MALSDLLAKIVYPKKATARFKRLDGYRRAFDGTLFDVLRYSFETETNGTSDIPIRERRPSIYYNIFKLLVDETSSLTFGEAHAPSIRVNMDKDSKPEESADVHTALELLVETLHLDSLMIKAMNLGATGSLLLVLRALPDKSPFVEFVEGQYCRPYFDPEDPRKISRVDQVYPVTAEDLDLAGYEGKYEPDKLYYIKITYDKTGKRASLPMEAKRYDSLGEKDEEGNVIQWRPDEDRSWANPFEFIPVLWVKNLDLKQGVDGSPTVNDEVISISIEISYMLSQSGRGYKYTADPIMMMKDGGLRTMIPLGGSDDDGESDTFFRSPAKVLRLSGDGADAKMLEISAQGLKASDEHVAILREYALELASGMKSESKDTGGMQSGKALEMLHAALVWLVEKFRTSYGEMCFLPLVQMIVKGIANGDLNVEDIDTSSLNDKLLLRLAWPEWSTPTGGDMQAEMAALATGVGSTPAFPVPFITVEMAGQKAASILGFGDQNRAAAQVLMAHEENPPLTARDAHEADQKNEKQKIANDHENNKLVTKGKIENDKAITQGKIANDAHIAKAKASSTSKGS